MSAPTSQESGGHGAAPAVARVTRADLVRYAGASGDFNPIHWSDRVATEVGLPGRDRARHAHDGVGQPAPHAVGRRSRRGAQLRRPLHPTVVVPDDERGALVELAGKVTAIAEGVAKVAITAMFDGRTVLGRAVAEVTLRD